MKKIFSLLLASVLTFSLAACGQGTEASSGGEAPAETTAGNPAEEATSEAASSASASDSAEEITAFPPANLPGVNADNYPFVSGSTANLPLMAALYSAVCGVSAQDAETFVQPGNGTGDVWRSLEYGEPGLLLVYEAPANIRAELEESGVWGELDITPIGRDGLVFLVNKDNPVDGLTEEQLTGIYSGQITDWAEAGGTAGPITPFQRNFESGSQTLFLNLLMKDTPPMEAPSELRPAVMGALIDAVANYDGSGGAIGFSVYYYANLMYESPSLKLLAVDGVAPSAESIGGGSYPLTNDFYAVIRKSEPEGSPTRLLRDWLLSEEGRELMRLANYVPDGDRIHSVVRESPEGSTKAATPPAEKGPFETTEPAPANDRQYIHNANEG